MCILKYRHPNVSSNSSQDHVCVSWIEKLCLLYMDIHKDVSVNMFPWAACPIIWGLASLLKGTLACALDISPTSISPFQLNRRSEIQTFTSREDCDLIASDVKISVRSIFSKWIILFHLLVLDWCISFRVTERVLEPNQAEYGQC